MLKHGSGPSRDRIEQEARLLAELAGPGLVPLRQVQRGPEGITLDLEAAACSLADVIGRRGRLPVTETRAVGSAAATALGRIHSAGFVHGDVKPANLLLTDGGELWLADLDAAAAADGAPLLRGTPGRVEPGATALASTDITALAATLVELLTGSVIDRLVAWSARELDLIGCPTELATDLAAALAGGESLRAQDFAALLDRGARPGAGRLPAPVNVVRGATGIATIDYQPVRH